jgi:hypothetical protein
MRVHYDPLDGFEVGGVITHDIPDSEWKAYRTLVDAANALEDRFVAGYAITVDEFAAMRGILTDEQIEVLKTAGVSLADVPAGKVYTEYHPDPPKREAISAEQAALENVQRNRALKKCEHRKQVGPFEDGTVRCASCSGILYGGTGIKRSINDVDERHYHNPGSVNPHDFDGTV